MRAGADPVPAELVHRLRQAKAGVLAALASTGHAPEKLNRRAPASSSWLHHFTIRTIERELGGHRSHREAELLEPPHLPVKPRQIMYRARPQILELTGVEKFGDSYFTQTLLPDYVDEHPETCAEWDIVWDARGHLTEPHTGRIVPLGTMEVRSYLGRRHWDPFSRHKVFPCKPKPPSVSARGPRAPAAVRVRD